MMFEIVGREKELALVDAFVANSHQGPAALVFEGEAGIGKSTLWHAAVTAARKRGLLVLSSRPAEAERDLAYIALGDLLDDVLDDVLPVLSLPRRRALEVTLLREEASGEPVDRRALAVAVRDGLQLLSEQQPLVIAIDDVQWLDSSSSDALAFALRRVAGCPVRLLLAWRRIDPTQSPEPDLPLGLESVERLRVGPFSVGALHRLLHDRLGRSFARQTLLRVHERSGGNPFFALELARVLDEEPDPLEPIPVPETLEELVRTRLSRLPAATRDALALAAALGTPSISLLHRAGIAPDTLEPALAAHVIEREDGTIRFTHPLLSSVLYRDLGDERYRVHRRLAEIVEDPLHRARHLALSSEEPDAAVAAVLDGAAALAAERSAFALAAELADRGFRLTPPDRREERHHRALAAGRAHLAAGEWTRARRIVSDLLEESDIGALRCDALLLQAQLEGLDRAVALLEEALHEATSRPALQALIHVRLAWASRFKMGFDTAAVHAQAALDLADELEDDALRVRALAMLTFLGCAVGDPEAPAHAAQAHDLAIAVGDPELLKDAINAQLSLLSVRSDVSGERALLERVHREWCERDELWAADALSRLAWVELWGGRWQLAADYADRAHQTHIQYGLEVPWVHLSPAVVAAHRGQLDLARAHSQRALQLGEEQFGLHPPIHLGILGIVALQAGDLDTAVERFSEAAAVTGRLGWREVSRRWWVADHVEALLGLDRVDDAQGILDAWEADAARLGRRRMLAHATRCHGLVAAARGAVEDAASLLERAVAQHEEAGDRFGQSRALLALGVVRRRQRQKRHARDAISAALAGFEQLGASTWIDKARAELGRIGGRQRAEGLTDAERRVAALVAEGRTNREVAAALFLGERTVETHLSHVYAKLGVRSRVELARTFRSNEQSSGGLTISS